MSYTTNVPQASQFISDSQPLIQTNFSQLNTQISVDHVALTAGSGNGQHKQISLSTYGVTPYTNTATQSYVYSRGVANGSSLRSCLEYQASQAAANLLPVTPKAMVRFNSSGVIQAGYSFNVTSVTLAAPVFTVNFTEALANTNYFVMVSTETSSTTITTYSVQSKATGSFAIRVNSGTNLSNVAVMVF